MKRLAVELGIDCQHFRLVARNRGTGSGRDRQAQRNANRRWYEANRHVYLERNRRTPR
jgi:hypothetical protein